MNAADPASAAGIHSPGADDIPLLDISRPVRPGMATWEDRFNPVVTWHSKFGPGERTANSTWTINAHNGTHIDAPYHHLPHGAHTDELPLTTYAGRCRVIDLTTIESAHVDVADLRHYDLAEGERILLRTRNSTVSADTFDPAYCALTPAAARYLAALPVRLVGVDGPSVEPYRTDQYDVHHTLVGGGVAVIEGLLLDDVPAGEYLLVSLPVHWIGAEAAPARAVLWPLDATDRL